MEKQFGLLEKYLEQFGYKRNAMLKDGDFSIPQKTAYEYLVKNTAAIHSNKCMSYMMNSINYGTFIEKIAIAAKKMKSIDIHPKDRVGVLLPNIPETAYLQYGINKIGGVVDHIDPRTVPQMIREFAKKEKIKTFVVLDVLYEKSIRPIERELKEEVGITDIIVVPAINSIHPILKGIVNINSILKGRKRIKSNILNVHYWDEMEKNSIYTTANTVPYVPNELAMIVHSSGTSSAMPKGIPLTNENMNSLVLKHKISTLNLQPGMKFLHILPYFAAYGSVNSAHLALNLGMNLIEIPEFNFEDIGQLLLKYKPNIILGVPNWWKIMARDSRLKHADLSFLKIIVAGGDSINQKEEEEINEFLKQHGAQCCLTKGYGMSELSGCGTFTFDGYNNVAGLGIQFPTDKYIILDDKKNIVPVKDKAISGEAYIYSPSATTGVLDGQKITEIVDIMGYPFISSKDIITIEPNGQMRFVERSDRTFTRYDGYKVKPYNIEKLIESEALVQKCMVVNYEDEAKMGNMPIAHIVLSQELTDEEKYDLIKKIVTDNMINSSRFTSRDIPKKWKFRESIPKTKMFKDDYRALQSEPLTGEEYTVDIRESNLKIDSVEIIKPEKKAILKKI